MSYTIYGDIAVVNKDAGIKTDKLPAGAWTINTDPVGNYSLARTTLTGIPEVLYGETEERAQRIISAYKRRSALGKNTGVLLSGTKGSGKTMLAKLVATRLIAEGVPVVLVTQAYTDAGFIELMSTMPDNVVVLFDEFDKVYEKKQDQESLLTVLDGTGSANKLFMLTKNSGWLSEFFVNRPSRILYTFDYDKITKETLLDYLEHNLDNMDHVPSFQRLWDVSTELSFDVIQGIVEELNAYPEETFKSCLNIMGIALGSGEGWSLEVVEVNGKKLSENWTSYPGNFSPMGLISGQHRPRVYLNTPSQELLQEIGTSSILDKDGDDDYFIELDGTKYNVELMEAGKIAIQQTTVGDTFRVVLSPKQYRSANLSSAF